MYIWELSDWPHFRWDSNRLAEPLAEAHFKEGFFLANMSRLGFDERSKAEVEALTEEAIKTSEIEGENLNRESVRSSVARRLGIQIGAISIEDRRVEGIVEITLDATKNFNSPLTRERLFGWHSALFPTGYSKIRRIKTGAWRDDADGPMQVLSGAYGHEKVHFQAPPADRIDREMGAFFTWFNEPLKIDTILKAAIAHLWFVTIHPFEDGNGRIARALADMILARRDKSPQRFYSLASEIRRERPEYYASLEAAQKGDMDITERLLWFTQCFSQAIDSAEQACTVVLRKADFWQRNVSRTFNERQREMLNRVLDGFNGNLTARKWSAITRSSMPTAQRDIKELIDQGLLIRNEGGSKNTSYRLAGLDLPSPENDQDEKN
ncbi:MAG TPA: Fic family protein [Nitrospira sp.]|nr:Fic family protein [Nitrospira sp.]